MECHDLVSRALPCRILAIEGTLTSTSVKVVETYTTNIINYAALSHCWGECLLCTLTKVNIEERRAGIPWEELPRTFQDAINYCVHLRLQYL